MTFRPFAATIAVAGLLGAVATAVAQNPKPVPVPEPPPTAADWELPAAYLRDNGLRGDVVLNAFWTMKGPAESDPLTRSRVPAYAYSTKATGVTYTREVTLPAGWETRRLTLEAGNFTQAGVVRFNGVELSKQKAKERFLEVDIPATAILPGAPQRIEIVTGMINDDMWLRSYPRSASIVDDTYITTSFRKQEVQLQAAGAAPAGQAVRPVLRIWSDAAATQGVKVVEPAAPVVAGADGRWNATLAAPWADAKLWSHFEPNLYWYTVDLEVDGKVVDRVLPRRFGFREVWKEGRSILLNGVPVHFMGDNWPSQIGNWAAMPQMARAAIANAKAMGLNGAYRIDSSNTLDACDELGMLATYVYLGALDIPVERLVLTQDQAGDAGGDVDQIGEEKLEGSKRRITRWMKRWREHPSILSWTARGPWQRGTLNSLLVGRIDDPWNYWPGNSDIEKRKAQFVAADQNVAFIRQLDPHRPVSAQNQPSADIELATRYLCDNLDLQEREQFFEDYTRSNSTATLWSSEHGTPFPGHQFIRKQDHQQPQGGNYPAIHLENAARQFGDGVYLEEPEERFRRWHTWKDEGHRFSPVYQRLMADNIWFHTRGWRAAGVSAHNHWIARDGFQPRAPKQTTDERWGVPAEVDPRQPGLSKASNPMIFPSLKGDNVLPMGQAYLRAMSPLVAYIGGAESPSNKDRAYVAGQPVRKTLVVLNDYLKSVDVSGEWQLVDAAGNVLQRGELSINVKPGERATRAATIAINAPVVEARSEYVLKVDLKSVEPHAEGALSDAFAITVFPPYEPAKPAFSGTVWTLAGTAAADDLPAKLNVTTSTLDANAAARVRSGDVILLPRNALSSPEQLETLRAVDFDGLVKRGARAVVFEQSSRNVMGLQTEDVRPRRAFIAAVGHPAFEGLADADLTFWNGASNLEPAAEPIPESELKVFPKRIWQVSNDNAVATRTLIRPQVGAARALAVSGFDLQESPLLEVAIGNGRILFCQFDVTNRYGSDPIATRLVDNLIRYAMTAPAPDADRSTFDIVAVGDGVEAKPNLYRADKPAGVDGWGMTRAEVFFRDSIYETNWITKRAPQTSVPVFAGSAALPAVIRRDAASGRYATTLDVTTFATGWSKKKVAYLHAAMRINQGGTSDQGPAVAHQDDAKALYPHPWLEGFVNPYTAACW